jgi:hypothetical protein
MGDVERAPCNTIVAMGIVNFGWLGYIGIVHVSVVANKKLSTNIWLSLQW